MKDLIKLYQFYSVHGTEAETAIADWVEERLIELGVKDLCRNNNTLYRITNKNKVMLSAHLDQVSTNGPAVHFYQKDDIIRAYNKDYQRTSLGADDKNGVWLILKTIEAGIDVDFIISEGEEVGCVGIKLVEDVIKESSATMCLVLDRRGNYDILKGGGGDVYCEGLAYNLKNFLQNGYAVNTGSISDTAYICKYIESVNMSVAYDNPHQATETTDFKRLNIIKEDIAKVVKDFVHYPAAPSSYIKTYTAYKGGNY